MMISSENTANVTEKGKMSCVPCRKGVASNSKRWPSSNVREVQVSKRYKRDKAESFENVEQFSYLGVNRS